MRERSRPTLAVVRPTLPTLADARGTEAAPTGEHPGLRRGIDDGTGPPGGAAPGVGASGDALG